MALPDNTLSVTPVQTTQLYPDSRGRDSLLADYEMGGIDLSDPSQGLRVQTWKAWSNGAQVYIAPFPALTPVTIIHSGTLISELALAFDQNMHPTLAYKEAGTLKLRWYDTTISSMVITSFPGCTSGMLCMDDKRDFATDGGSNDVLFFYIRAGAVYYRQQRDRYLTERFLANMPAGLTRIHNVGMNVGNRIQIKLWYP